MTQCKRCGRQLRSQKSIEREHGEVCFSKKKRQEKEEVALGIGAEREAAALDSLLIEPEQEVRPVREVKQKLWFTTSTHCIGIILSEDTVTHERKGYIAVVEGQDEDADVQHILDHGAKVLVEHAKILDKHFKGE